MASMAAVRSWHIPLSAGNTLIADAKQSLSALGAAEQEIPLIIQLVENPKFDFPGVDIFNGATYLDDHDYIHILLGRGLMPLDEAFVIGFTMGSTNKVSSTEERLFTFIAKHLYPRPYRFNNEAVQVFKDAVRLGFVSRCKRLDKVNYRDLQQLSVGEARKAIGLEEDLLRAYYRIEQSSFPHIAESQRLLDNDF